MRTRQHPMRWAALTAALTVPWTAAAVPLLNDMGGTAGYGTNVLAPNDDSSSGSIPIAMAFGAAGVNFFGTSHTAMFVNNNGNITFRGAVGTFTPTPFPIASQPMIAPWWADVDTRGAVASPPGANRVYWDVRPGRATITWHLVGYYSSGVNLLNDFQLVLYDRSAQRVAGDFDVEFRYNRCQWTTGSASGGSGGLGGTPAQAGFDAGNTRDFVTLPGSRTMAVLNLCTTTNVTGGAPGLWQYQVRSGGVAQCGNNVREAGEECDDGNTTPGDGCSASCRTELMNGANCMAGDQCRSGFCTDGVCCAARCDGQCERCNATGTAGTCTAVTGAPVGGRSACLGTGTCAGTCNGTNRAACTYPNNTVSCGAGSCTMGTATAVSTCNGMGVCATGATSACAPYVCGATSCLTSCMTDSDCTAGNFCNEMQRCVPRLPPGGACTRAGACASGNCVDGVCCNTACNGQCEACDVMGSVGTCTAVTGAPRGGRTACAGTGTCGGTCDGMNRTACNYPGMSTQCRAASCADGSATLAASCDGEGGCPAPSTTPCAPFACGATACLTECTTNEQCAMGSACISGTCQGRRPNGGMCGTANECQSGNCVDGVCCNTACNGQCEACDVEGSLGTCAAVTGAPRGARTACTGTGACAGACNGMNREACTFPGATTSCGAASCSGGVATAAGACDGMGACGMGAMSPCVPYGCGETACRTTCATDGECAPGFMCANGACVMAVVDAGTPDAGTPDAGTPDAGSLDAGTTDAGTTDAGMKQADVVAADVPAMDSGTSFSGELRGDGCTCSTPGTGRAARGRGVLALAILAGLSMLRTRRRR